MARKRMFDIEIIDTDLFLEMPMSARLLYYDLGMRADDDGFVSNPKKIMKMTGSTQDDLNILLLKQYIIPFDTGVCVIKHWKINNYLRKDRYTKTIYTKEKEQLKEDENGAYYLPKNDIGIPMVDTEKKRIEENSKEEISIDNNNIDIYSYIEHEFARTLSPTEFEQIEEWLLLYSEEIIKFAVKVAVSNGKKIFSYVNGILNNWRGQNLTTLEEIKVNSKPNKKTDEVMNTLEAINNGSITIE